MRDPNRIPRILEKLNRAWQIAPDMRLAQLIYCITTLGKDPELSSNKQSIFHTEDDEIEQRLDEWLANPPRVVIPQH